MAALGVQSLGSTRLVRILCGRPAAVSSPILPQRFPHALHTDTQQRSGAMLERRMSVQAGAARAAASCCAAAAPAVAAPLLSSEIVNTSVVALTVYHCVLFAVMMVSRNIQPVRSFMRSRWPYLPLALGYCVLLANSWAPDTLSIMMPGSLQEGLSGGFNPQFFPRLESVMTLFQRPATAASWLVHVWAINLYLGRTIFLEGMASGIPTWHSLLLACFFGPLGLLSHSITKAICKPSVGPAVVLREGSATITIMPYE